MQIGEAFVVVRPDSRGFGQQLDSDVSRAGASAARALGAALAGGQAIRFLQDAVGEASDLAEATNLVGVTFGNSADEVLAFGENSAQSIGLANSETLQFASNLGGLFVGLGSSREEAAGLSQEILRLASDLASAKNLAGGTTEAVERLTAGIVGEVEPLRRLGIAFSAADVQQRAMADTGVDNAAALTQGQLAAARYAIILEQLTAQGVVGDFARTSDGLANSQRILNAEWTNAQAALGESLLPTMLQLVDTARSAAPLLGSLGPAFESAAAAATVLTLPLQLLVPLLMEADQAVAELSGGLGSAFDFAGQTGQLTLMVRLGRELFGGEGGVGVLNPEDIDEVGAAAQRLGLEFGGDARIGIEEFAAAVGSLSAESGFSAVDILNELGVTGAYATAVLGILGGAGENVAEAIAGMAPAADRAVAGLDAEAEALSEVAAAADEVRDKLDALFGIQQSVAEGAIDLRAGTRDLRDQLAELGAGGYVAATESGDAFLTSLQDQAATMREHLINLAAEGATTREVADAQRILAGSIREIGAAAGVPQAEIEELLRTFGLLPAEYRAELTADGGPARAELQRTLAAMTPFERRQFRAFLSADGKQARTETANVARNALSVWDGTRYAAALDADAAGVQTALQQAIGYGNDWEGRVFQARLEAQFTASGVAGQAAGGPYRAGRAHLVGEQGPELRVEDHDGFTFTAAQTRDLMRGGGSPGVGEGGVGDGNTLVVNVNIGTLISDTAEAAKQLAPDIAREINAFQESW